MLKLKLSTSPYTISSILSMPSLYVMFALEIMSCNRAPHSNFHSLSSFTILSNDKAELYQPCIIQHTLYVPSFHSQFKSFWLKNGFNTIIHDLIIQPALLSLTKAKIRTEIFVSPPPLPPPEQEMCSDATGFNHLFERLFQ